MVERLNAVLRVVPTRALYLVGALPAPWLFWQGLTGGLGVEPIEALEHAYGELALQFVVAGLCVTPLRRYVRVNLLKFRRALGLLAFFYVTLHLAVWAILDVQALDRVWADIVERPYITIGMAGFLLMLPLAATSNAWSLRWLGAPGWQRLHKLTYGVALLGAVHFVMLSKGFQLEPLIYLAAILGLLALRLRPPRRLRPATG